MEAWEPKRLFDCGDFLEILPLASSCGFRDYGSRVQGLGSRALGFGDLGL